MLTSTTRIQIWWMHACGKLCIFLGIVMPSLIHGQPVITLEEAMNIALDKNFQLQILESNQQIARNNNNLANAGFLPRVSATGNVATSSNNTEQKFFNGDSRGAASAGSSNARASAEATWTIFDGFRRQAIREGLGIEEQRSAELINAEELALIEAVHLSYFQIGELQQQIDLTRRSIQLNNEILDLALQRQRIGVASEAEVLQARSQLNADSVILITQLGELDRMKNSFNRLLNRDLQSSFRVDTLVALEQLPPQSQLLTEAKSANPALILAKLDQVSTALQIKEIKSVLYPRLDINAAYNYNFSRAEVGFLLSNRTFGPTAGLTFTYDIFSGRNLKQELENVSLLQQNLITDQQRIERDLESQIADLYLFYQNLDDLRTAEVRNIGIAEQNTLLANELYRQGRNTSFEVREAVLREIQAKNRLVQANYQMKYVEIQLKRIAALL